LKGDRKNFKNFQFGPGPLPENLARWMFESFWQQTSLTTGQTKPASAASSASGSGARE
jgi:hypothetical protein